MINQTDSPGGQDFSPWNCASSEGGGRRGESGRTQSGAELINQTDSPGSRCFIRDALNDEFRIDEDEEKVRSLWKDYFKTLAIKERENPKLQQHFVPLIYRKHMTEFDD